MDRTKEYLSIVHSTEVPQQSCRQVPFYNEVHGMDAQIKSLVLQLSKITVYESFKVQSILNQAHKLLKEFKEADIRENVTGDYLEVVRNLKGIIKTNSLKYTLKLSEVERRNRKQTILPTAYEQGSQSQAVCQEELTESKQKEEFVSERRRIVKSISEIGQIVEDISIHVSLQEEQLKRIDDVVLKTDYWSKKTLSELKETWAMTSDNRKRIIKFFAFWVAVFLLFWMLRR